MLGVQCYALGAAVKGRIPSFTKPYYRHEPGLVVALSTQTVALSSFDHMHRLTMFR